MATPQQQERVVKTAAKGNETQTAARGNVAQKELTEVQTAQACVATAVQARDNQIEVTLPKVCEKYIKQARQDKDR